MEPSDCHGDKGWSGDSGENESEIAGQEPWRAEGLGLQSLQRATPPC